MDQKLLRMHRRSFLKGCAVAVAANAMPVFGMPTSRAALLRKIGEGYRALDFVRPMIGTGWHGHMFPGAVSPFGLVQLSPDTSGPHGPVWNGKSDYYQWDHCSGYHYPDNVILGFSHTHLQGTGAIDLGDVLVMPMVEGRNWGWTAGAPGQEAEAQSEAIGGDSGWVFSDAARGYRSIFSHATEEARAGYYAVHLATPDVYAELTSTTRCGMHRYSYPALPAETRRGLMLDVAHGLGCKVYAAELRVESPTRVSGSRFTHGWAKDRQVYFVMELSQPAASVMVQVDGKVQAASPGDRFSGEKIRAIFSLPAGASEPLIVRVGISCTGIEGAMKNLSEEIPHWNFDDTVRENERGWERTLGVLTAEFPSSALQQTFATGAYHGLVAPATFNDVDGTYRGQDRKNHPNPGFTKYTTLSIWDIYRGEFPFLMLMQPHRVDDILRALLVDYQQLDRQSLPVWPLWGNETWCMPGFHVVGMIAGAYVRGFRDFDVNAMYTAMRETALVGSTANGNREYLKQFQELGYIATGPKRGAVSRTLDYSYDYWCVGAMAELLGKREDAVRFYQLGQSYKNIFDRTTGFMRGKTKEGKWREPFRPDEVTDDYTESDAWQATFNVMQDVQGLIDLYGGGEAFIAKLDALFTAPSKVLNSPPDVSGMVGQDAQGDEPSNHIPYLYTFAGAPWKTQHWVRKVAGLYRNTPQGIPGNDDCGQMSSWFVFAALGFYPVNAVNGVYIFGSPLVKRARLRNSGAGTTFTILAENNSLENVYIQSAELNGKRLSRAWITHAEIVAGGELRFVMSDRPNKDWGAAAEDRPPSGLIKYRA